MYLCRSIKEKKTEKETLMTGLRSGGNRNLTAAAGGARATYTRARTPLTKTIELNAIILSLSLLFRSGTIGLLQNRVYL